MLRCGLECWLSTALVAGMDVLMSLVAGKKMEAAVDNSGLLEEVRARAARDAGGFHTASDAACARPMLEVAWPAMLAVFSMAFEASEAPGAGPHIRTDCLLIHHCRRRRPACCRPGPCRQYFFQPAL